MPFTAQQLRKPGQIIIARIIMALLLLGMSATTWRAAAATNAFIFSPTTLSAGSAGAGPVNPANGSGTINGTSLTAGDVIVFDGIVANVNGITGDNWGLPMNTRTFQVTHPQSTL